MNNRKLNVHRLYFAIFLAFLIVIVFILKYNTTESLKEFVDVNNEIVVIFNNEVAEKELNELISSLDDSVKVVRHLGEYALLNIGKEHKYDYVLEELKKNPKVHAAEANSGIAITGLSNDTYADSQWAIDNSGQYIYLSDVGKELRSAIEDVDMDVIEAWDAYDQEANEQREIVVAIIDTGVDYTHPDLDHNMWVNTDEIPDDGIDNDNNGFVDDVYGWDFYNDDASVCHYKYNENYQLNLALPEDNDNHGTHIAGIIGAIANNNIGIAGVASNINIKIMSLKINGGPEGTGNISDSIEAIKYATMMGADICNLSWGTTQYTETLHQVIKESDMLFIAAAGNSGANNNSRPIYPASFQLDNLISVTFIDSEGKLTDLSNFGISTVDLAAPGEDILSTVVGSYASMSGSSMAVPHVSAVAAILYAYGDNIYPSNVKEIILNNIKVLPGLEEYMIHPGIPNAYLSLMASNGLVNDIDEPQITMETKYSSEDILVSFNAQDKGGSGIRVSKWIIGERTLEEFHRGTTGTEVLDNQITVSKAGIYTFYAADYAGNETIVTYEIVEDTSEPKITPTYTVADDYEMKTVTIRVVDTQSGVKRVKYKEGKIKASDFLPAGAGTVIELKNGKGIFKVKEDGIYSIFASDYRGNLTIHQIEIKAVKATEIKFLRSQKTMEIGEQYRLGAFVSPANNTDKISYTSSNAEVVTVSSIGRLTALKEGTAYVSARTSSGKTVKCEITVKKTPRSEDGRLLTIQ